MATPTVKDWAARSSALDAVLGRSSGANDNSKKTRSTPHIVEEDVGGGKIRVHEFASKKEAKAFGMSLRAKGKTAFMHEKGSKWSQSAQNPASVVGGDEIARDEQGRFAPK